MDPVTNGEPILPEVAGASEAGALLDEVARIRRGARLAWRRSWARNHWFVLISLAVVILGSIGLEAAIAFGYRGNEGIFRGTPRWAEQLPVLYWAIGGMAVLILVRRRQPRHVSAHGAAELLIAASLFGLGFAVTFFSYAAYNHEYLAPSLFAAALLAVAAAERRTSIGAAAPAVAGALAILVSITAREASWAVARIQSPEGISDLRLFMAYRGWPALLAAGAFLGAGVVLRALHRRAR